MTERETGTVKWFNDIRGEGRISRGTGKKDVSVHYSDIEGEGYRTLRKGQRVAFNVEQGIKWPKAIHVRPIGPS